MTTTIPTRLINNRPEEVFSSSSVITSSQTEKTLSNRTASGPVTLTLPDAFSVVGETLSFAKTGGNTLTLLAAGTDTISDSVAGGTISNSEASEPEAYLELKSVKTGVSSAVWLPTQGFGTWVVA